MRNAIDLVANLLSWFNNVIGLHDFNSSIFLFCCSCSLRLGHLVNSFLYHSKILYRILMVGNPSFPGLLLCVLFLKMPKVHSLLRSPHILPLPCPKV